jgi:ankyrin repeat protein
MYKAALNNKIVILELMLRHGPDCNLPNESKPAPAQTPMDLMVHSIRALMDATHNSSDTQSNYAFGETALHAAAYSGHDNIVQLLIDNGADIDAVGAKGGAVDLVARCKHDKFVKTLLRAGA